MASQPSGEGQPTTVLDPSADDLGGQAPYGPVKGRGYRMVVEWVIILIAVLLCTVLLRTYVVQSFYIPSA